MIIHLKNGEKCFKSHKNGKKVEKQKMLRSRKMLKKFLNRIYKNQKCGEKVEKGWKSKKKWWKSRKMVEN